MAKLSLIIFLLSAAASALASKTVELKLYPPEVRVHAGEAQTLLLLATDGDGVTREVTTEAKWNLTNPSAALAAPRTLQGIRKGSGELAAYFDGVTAKVAVEVLPERNRELSFINDIVPVFTRASCASSNCHGSVRGQKGFKLSLIHI